MPDRDTKLLNSQDFAAALGLLTRLPTPPSDRGAAAAWAWPMAGALVGLIAGLVGWCALTLGLNSGLAAALALAATALATGAMHEDGLADTADGLWGGWTRERRLEIMHDSRIGTYGTLALILVTLARWSALSALFSAGSTIAPLVAAAALSRAPMALMMQTMPRARADGLSVQVGAPSRETVFLGLALALALALLFTGPAVIPAALAVGTVALAMALIARARIGGQTGDILGATQQLGDLAALAALSALL